MKKTKTMICSPKIKHYLNNIEENAKDRIILNLLTGKEKDKKFIKKHIKEFWEMYPFQL